MWEHCGIVRSIKGLKAGMEKLAKLEDEVPKIEKNSPLEAFEFRNFLESARLVVKSALNRKESRGLQCLTDYPEKKASGLKHYTLCSNPEERAAANVFT
jgi:L-aspartate oxidase